MPQQIQLARVRRNVRKIVQNHAVPKVALLIAQSRAVPKVALLTAQSHAVLKVALLTAQSRAARKMLRVRVAAVVHAAHRNLL